MDGQPEEARNVGAEVGALASNGWRNEEVMRLPLALWPGYQGE